MARLVRVTNATGAAAAFILPEIFSSLERREMERLEDAELILQCLTAWKTASIGLGVVVASR